MKHKAVLFDLDGTLLDTIEDLADSMNAALGGLGFPPRSVEQCKLYVGDGVEQFARRALPEGRRDESTVAACIELMGKDYAGRWAVKTRPYDGVAEMLDGLAARGVASAVLSNKPDEFVKVMVSQFLKRWSFAAVRGAIDGVPRKPDPKSALQIAAELDIETREYLYLGDTGTDMKTANAAGMYAVGALWGFRTADELTANGAMSLIERPLDLLSLI